MNEIKHREERKLRLEQDDYDKTQQKTQQGGKRHSTRRTKKRRGTKRQIR